MILDNLLQWIHATSLAEAIRVNDVLFPCIEAIHVMAITLVLGSIALLDFRLIGIASRNRSIKQTMSEVLPLTWTAFFIVILTGFTLFSSNAVNYAHNFYFQCKMLLILLAGLNAILFEFAVARNLEKWDALYPTPWRAKCIGTASLCLWIAVIWLGRQIGFSMLS